MKVLHVNNYHYVRGGADKYFLDVVDLLRTNGVEAYSYAPADIRDRQTKTRVHSAVPSIDTNSFSLSGVAHYHYSLSHLRAIREAVRELKPDIVHLHLFHGQISSSIVRELARADVKVVQTLHDHKLFCPVGTALKNHLSCNECAQYGRHRAVVNRCHKRSFRRSALIASEDKLSSVLGYPDSMIDKFICVSEYLASSIQRAGRVDPSSLAVLPNFTHLPTSQSRRREGILFVGRIEEQKGITTLIDAFSRVPRRQSAQLFICGDGPFLEEAKRFARALTCGSSVHFLGQCDRASLNLLYGSARLFVNPSEYAETFGLVTAEAMAHYTVTVATNIGASPELLGEDARQFLFTPGDSQALAEIIDSVLNNPGFQQAWGPYFRNRVEEKFSPRVHFEGLMSIYKELGQAVRW